MVSNYLQLSNHSGVVVSIFILASLQFEGAAEISQPFEVWDILQFAVIHLRIHNHSQEQCNNTQVNKYCCVCVVWEEIKLTLRVSYPFLR